MKTRRKSKAAAAAAAAASQGHSTRENSPAPAPATHDATITVVIPDDVDTSVLTNLLPDFDLQSPSADAIVALYRLVAAQATDNDATQRELEEARAEIERKSVELEQALQDKESATSELETTLDSVRKELEQVKREKDELGAYQKCSTPCSGLNILRSYLPCFSASTDHDPFDHDNVLFSGGRHLEAPDRRHGTGEARTCHSRKQAQGGWRST